MTVGSGYRMHPILKLADTNHGTSVRPSKPNPVAMSDL